MDAKTREHIAIVNWLPEETYYKQAQEYFNMPLGFVNLDDLITYLTEEGIYQEYLEYKKKKKKKQKK